MSSARERGPASEPGGGEPPGLRGSHRARPVVIGALASSGLHIGLALWLFSLPTPETTRTSRASELTPYVDVDAIGGAAALGECAGEAPSEATPIEAGGRESVQNVDSEDRGQGGSAIGAARVIRLTPRAEAVLLFDSPMTALARGQTQRIRTARHRTTREDRRATPNPHDQVFLASGRGHVRERRPLAARDHAAGARSAPSAASEGTIASPARRMGESDYPTRASRPREGPAGSASASPGRGTLEGRGRREGDAAPVAHGRPAVDEGPAATPAERRDARVQDDTDAELLAADMVQSWVDASPRRGRVAGEGRGGTGAGGAAGSGGGQREGGRATAHAPGPGRHGALDTSDARYVRWFLEQRRRVADALSYPRARAVAMDQGTSVFAVTVRRDGGLASPPRLVRSSGFADLDAAALAAIRAAEPFGPIPPELVPGRDTLSVRFPIEFSNPMVR